MVLLQKRKLHNKSKDLTRFPVKSKIFKRTSQDIEFTV